MQVQMKYTVYKTTNKINGNIYVGTHKTTDLNDDYLGSGTNIKRAIKKYGRDNFQKEYLAIFDNPEDMFEMESQIVNEDFITSAHTYNIVEGGNGGFDHINNNVLTKSMRSEFGGWNDERRRRKRGGKEYVYHPLSKTEKENIGKYMGTNFGGSNKLTEVEVSDRLDKIKDIDLTKYGWVRKVSERLNISHTQTKRFIDEHYDGEIYRRK